MFPGNARFRSGQLLAGARGRAPCGARGGAPYNKTMIHSSIARVAVLSPPYAELSYSLPEHLPAGAFAVGQRVVAPLGKGLRVGVITGLEAAGETSGDTTSQATSQTIEKPARQSTGQDGGFVLKPLVWPLEKAPLLAARYLDLALQLAHRQNETIGRILASMLPAGLRTTQLRLRFFGKGRPRELRLKALAELTPEELRALGTLWTDGAAEVCRADKSPLDAEVCLLAQDPPWPVRPAATAQIALLEYLFERGVVTRRALADGLGKGASATLALLAGRGLVRIALADGAAITPESDGAPEGGPPIAPPMPGLQGAEDGSGGACFCLTPQQKEALDPLWEAAAGGEAGTRLLFGITGSGKTAVYLELARRVLAAGRSVLLLAPEVALALKLWGDVKAALSEDALPRDRRLLYHGYQSQAARERAFRTLAEEGRTADAAPRLVVGTRSALLLPLSGIGLIVLDEEHDASFKQDEGFVYQAKEVAWYRASQERALLLLGSATPDVKSFHAARQGAVPLHTLTERVGGGTLPVVRLVPIGKSSTVSTASLLAAESLESLRAVVERGEQAVILLNRRGYAPLMYCRSCAAVAKCPHCDIALAYHKGRERLLCHYCGWSQPFPSPCASCGTLDFLPMGEGTEKLEESLYAVLPPGTGVLRLDRDSTRRAGRMEAILADFAAKKASVLVGTQMLSKGHHFPEVTLAVVADADLGLNLPDYRAAERTFQLLVQSAGRAGRGDKPGEVIIQTRDPGHYCWEFVRQGDYEGFFEQEIALRKRRQYPPFVRLALIRISHAMDDEHGQAAVTVLGAELRREARSLGVTLLGPAPAPLPFLKGRKRWHCLVKGDDWQPLRALYSRALEAAAKTALKLRLDLDPVNML